MVPNIYYSKNNSQYFRSKIRVGEYTISNSGKDCSSVNRHQCNAGHQDFEIEKIISHPEYDSRTAKKDIAIIKLKNNIIQNG